MKVIAAVALDGAIGKDNKLLWNLPEDLKRYKDRTFGNICIVGENTYYSLPDVALKNRTHIVVSGDYGDKMKSIDAPEEEQPRFKLVDKKEIPGSNVYNRSTIKEAIDTANEISREDQEIFIIGGAQIYETMIDHVDDVEITWINQLYPDADRHFPIDKLFNEFEIIGDSNYIKSDNGILYKFTLYERINKRYKLSKDD